MTDVPKDIMEAARRAYFDPFNGGDSAEGSVLIMSIARAILAERERRTPDVVTVPDGWKLVPIEPCPEMVGAWYRYKNGHHFADEPPPSDRSDYGAYRAMLAAAPSLSSGEGRSEERG